MRKEKSYILTSIEEKIRLLNSVNYDYEIIKFPHLSTTKLLEVRRKYRLNSYRDALRKIIEDEIKSELKSYEYQDLCEFLIENDFASDINLIPDESLKIKFLKRIANQTDKAKILASIDDDELKKEYLKGLKKESDRLIVICSLSSDEAKLEYFDKITDYHKQSELIASLESDNLKLEYIFSGKIHSNTIGEISASLKDDEKKQELLDLILSDTARFRVICTLKDDNLKEKLFEEKIRSEYFRERKRPALILSLSLEEQLRRISEFDDGLKSTILQNCDLETQFKLLPLIKDEKIKGIVFDRIPPEALLKYMAFNYSDTTNYWVRTDSEEREANVPRDDREEMVSEIVKFSRIPAKNKVMLIRTYVKDEDKIRELLKLIPYDVVISEYFNVKQSGVNIEMLEQIARVYDLENRYDVVLTADRGFDFYDSKNIELLNKVVKMKYPKFLLDKISYTEYTKWKQVFENTDVIILPTNVNISGLNLSLQELQELALVSEQVIFADNCVFSTKKLCAVKELLQDIFPLNENEKIELIRKELESSVYQGLLGETLKFADIAFEKTGFTATEKQVYGERLLKGLYKQGQEKGIIQSLALSEEAVDLLEKWDSSCEILKNDFESIAFQMTKKGIKHALDIMLDQGNISEDFAISYIFEYLSEQVIPQRGIGYAKKISKELLHTQNLKACDIEVLNPGSFSNVFLIGDYVVKVGVERETKDIPKHDRILPSLLRFEVKEPKIDVSSFLEVQPKVRTIPENQPFDEEIMYEIYADLRNSHIIWGDVAVRNIGFLDKEPNIPDNLFARLKKELELTERVTIYHDDKTDIKGPILDRASRVYIMDTDFLYPINEEEDNSSLRIPSVISYEYEMRYQKEKAKNKYFNSNRYKKAFQNLQKNLNEIFEER